MYPYIPSRYSRSTCTKLSMYYFIYLVCISSVLREEIVLLMFYLRTDVSFESTTAGRCHFDVLDGQMYISISHIMLKMQMSDLQIICSFRQEPTSFCLQCRSLTLNSGRLSPQSIRSSERVSDLGIQMKSFVNEVGHCEVTSTDRHEVITLLSAVFVTLGHGLNGNQSPICRLPCDSLCNPCL